MKQELAEQQVQEQQSSAGEALPDTVPVPRSMLPRLKELAILLDIDGTLLDLAPTPREVWVPPGLSATLSGLLQRTSGALALVSGRSLNDIDLIFAPDQFPAVGGHGAEMRLAINDEAVSSAAPLVWDRTRSAVSSCKDDSRPRAPGGGASYHLTVSIGGIQSPETAQFLLY